MLVNTTYSKHIGFLLVLFLLWVVPTKIAHADPHALFYTTTGQQQLFFNVLAALDQADYVEPATPDLGLSTGNSREELLQKRSEVGFGPVNDERATSTQTELSSLVTRSVTLEGNDLWTSYLLYQFALEAARRNGTSEVNRVYCNIGLGLKKCLEKDQEGETIEDQKAEAFIVDPIKRDANANYLAVTGALESSYNPGSRYQLLSDSLDKENRKNDEYADLRDAPLPFDLSLANLRARNEGSAGKSSIINLGTEIARRVLGGAPSTDESTLDGLDITNGGDVSLATSSNESSANFVTRYVDKLGGLLDLPNSAISVGSRGKSVAKSYLNTTDVDGAVADTKADRVALPDNPVVSLGREATVNVPAHAKVAITQSAVETLPQQEANLTSAPAEAESLPGTVELVNREATAQNPGGGGGPTALNTSGNSPQVAGDTTADDISESGEYHAPKTPLSPNTNPIHFHHEEAPEDFLLALGYDVGEEGCGCEASQYLTSYAQSILSAIQNAN